VKKKVRLQAGAVASIALMALLAVPAAASSAAASVSSPTIASPGSDPLYVGDVGDNTVKRFDATGSSIFATTVSDRSDPSGLQGPTGLIYNQGSLLVANQNVNLPFNGSILKYNDGPKCSPSCFRGALIPYSNEHAPPAPRGIIVTKGHLFVASESGVPVSPTTGELQEFDANSGKFISEYAPNVNTFHPRGVVLGPDGYLYVSNDPVLGGLGGQVLRFDPNKLASGPKDVFINDPTGGLYDFNRPEGLVFSPDGKLYVTSFQNATTSSSDKILIFGKGGQRGQEVLQGKINLDPGGTAPRTFAQALLFGPGGHLYVPISNTGAVRNYNVRAENCQTKGNCPFAELKQTPSAELVAPYYLTFTKTNPATLAYEP
jgi:hypothetical protein